MKLANRIALGFLILLALGAAAAWLGYKGVRGYYESQLPPISDLHNIKLGEPLRVYTEDGKLIGQFGAERREPLTYDQIPKRLREAFLAAEDSDFFHHGAVDWPGLMRAAMVLVTTGQKRQGGSTITMQLARDLFLSPQKTYTRKIKEILLAQRIEKTLTKEQILTLYLNRVFLGNRAYGVGAAAHVYYGKDVDKLTLSEMATLAGLPKAPSRDNPISSPEYAKQRRDYVLGRMHSLGWIDDSDYHDALAAAVVSHEHAPGVQVEASYVAEMVRAEMVKRYGDAVYSSGDTVTTTINSKDQAAAVAAVRAGLLAYTKRHGYDGPEGKLTDNLLAKLKENPQDPDVIDALDSHDVVGGLIPAVVVQYSPDQIQLASDYGSITLKKQAFDWAHLGTKNALHPGDIVRLVRAEDGWELSQVPKVQGALVSLDPKNGAVRALVGGFDFYANRYNRVVQAQRQVGSGFKPYLYSSALAAGYTPASVFLDAPVVLSGSSATEDTWRPQNDDGEFGGPMRMREALVHSVNLVSIRILQAVGIDYARSYIAPRFGIPKDRIPDNLTAALGTAALTPLEQARGYSVFANGGFLINPYFIASIRAQDGTELFHASPLVACPGCSDDAVPASPSSVAIDRGSTPPAVAAPTSSASAPGINSMLPQAEPQDGHAPRVLTPVTDYLITSMMHDVILRGTGHAANALGRHDLAGKTGTTNDQTDAWFNGFNPSLVAVSWVGFDSPHSLGYGEYGSRAALPIWMTFMKRALDGAPEQTLPQPPGVVSVRIDPKTGKRVGPGFSGAMNEVVQADHLPPEANGPEGNSKSNNPADSLY